MKLRFREKTYLITLVLFLLFLNTGIFSLAYYTYDNNMDAAEELCREEERVISEAFAKDCEYLNYNSSKRALMKTYCDFYYDNDIRLMFFEESAFSEGGNYICSNLPSGIAPPNIGESSTQRSDGKRYFTMTQKIDNGEIAIVYAKDVSYLDEDFKNISVVFVLTSLFASVLLALCLFVVLRKLSQPLEKLRTTAGEIADGNFESRADDSGSDEFSLLAKDFNRMAEHIGTQMNALEENAKTKQRMLDNLAHEMRTPLTSIRGYAEYLRDANIGEEEKIEAVEFIISESERLKAIGERMLDEAFIRENKIIPEQVNLGELIFGAVKKLTVKAANAGVALRADANEIFLNCDKLLTELLITNLADNAIKACRGRGTVIIGCEREAGATRIFVADNGVGMTEEQLAHITEPFYRTDKSRSRDEGGTGLGLSLCQRIADAHGAELKFESEPEKGTKAVVTFTDP